MVIFRRKYTSEFMCLCVSAAGIFSDNPMASTRIGSFLNLLSEYREDLDDADSDAARCARTIGKLPDVVAGLALHVAKDCALEIAQFDLAPCAAFLAKANVGPDDCAVLTEAVCRGERLPEITNFETWLMSSGRN